MVIGSMVCRRMQSCYGLVAHGLRTRRPSREGAVARLKLYVQRCVSKCFAVVLQLVLGEQRDSMISQTYTVAFLPSSSCAKTQTCPHRPRSSLEEENREDDAKRGSQRRPDEESAEAMIPLPVRCQYQAQVFPRILRLGDFDTFSFNRASLRGLLERAGGGAAGVLDELESAIASLAKSTSAMDWRLCAAESCSKGEDVVVKLKLRSQASRPASTLSRALERSELAGLQKSSRTSRTPTSFATTSPLSNMGGPPTPAQTSLDRLRGLDSLPDLQSQLHEAQQLCNHSSRAEMILKWLLGKLKSSQPSRRSLASWQLLSSAVQLLPKHKTAILLGTNGFMDLVQITCVDSELSAKTIIGLAHLLNLIFESAQHSDGAALSAVLSVDGEGAASTIGQWMQHIYNASVTVHGDQSLLLSGWLLSPALHIWNWRKRNVTDDEMFNTNCLRPAILLLARLKSLSPQSAVKRKRGQEYPDSGITRWLESRIAIHTILPARSVFLDSRSASTPSQLNRNPLPPQPTIKERLGPLKMAVLVEQTPDILAAIPLIMDIALRSVSMPTPKHRLNERVWIEALVEALQSCVGSKKHATITSTLTTVLGVVRSYNLTLSLPFFSNLFGQQGLLDDLKSPLDWVLIAEIVKMDSNVFLDQSLSAVVFDATTTFDIEQGNNADATQAPLVSLKDDIIIPVMRAFVKSRKALEFAITWHKQLSRLNRTCNRSVWMEIAVGFSEDLEDTMSHEQVLELFDRLKEPLNGWVATSAAVSTTDWSVLNASVVQLYSVVRGIRSDELQAKLHSRLGALRKDMFAMQPAHRERVPDILLQQLYQLLTRVFQLWFASWAALQDNEAAVPKLAASLFESSLIQSAREVIAAKPESKVASTARMLIATICNQFQPFNQNEHLRRLTIENIRLLSEHTGLGTEDVFILYPSLLENLDPTQLRGVITACLANVNVQLGASCQLTKAIALTVTASVRKAHTENAVAAALSELTGPLHTASSIQFLSSLGPTKLSQDQRTAILDALVQLDVAGPLRQQRLSLLLSLLPGARRDNQLLKDPSLIWHLAAASDTDAVTSNTWESTQIFEEITRTILESWLGSKDHQWGRDTLAQFSKYAGEYIRKAAKISLSRSQLSSIAITKVAITMLSDQVSPGYSEKLIHKDEKSMKLFMKALVKEIKSFCSSVNMVDAMNGAQHVELLCYAMDVLASMPQSICSVESSKEIADQLLPLVQQVFDSNKVMGPDAARFRGICYQLIHRYGEYSLERLSEVAKQTLESDLHPTSRDQLLTMYAGAAHAADTAQKLSAARCLLPRLAHSLADLVLYREVTSKIDKDELSRITTISGDGQLSGTELVQPVVQAALNAPSVHAKQTALQSLVLIIRKQSYFLNQYGVEQVIYVTHQLLETYPYVALIYMDACGVLNALFDAQRARLQGRFHLLVRLFQAFVTALFRESKDNTSRQAPIRHARTLARLLDSFCSPPPARHRGKSSGLVDEARKAQSHAGQYAQYILHHYCSQILSGSLGNGVREALMPGLWAVIQAMEVNNRDGIKSLSAAMNNSERAVLRSVYDEWKRFGKWEGS